jgi:hypothetical protein
MTIGASPTSVTALLQSMHSPPKAGLSSDPSAQAASGTESGPPAAKGGAVKGNKLRSAAASAAEAVASPCCNASRQVCGTSSSSSWGCCLVAGCHSTVHMHARICHAYLRLVRGTTALACRYGNRCPSHLACCLCHLDCSNRLKTPHSSTSYLCVCFSCRHPAPSTSLAAWRKHARQHSRNLRPAQTTLQTHMSFESSRRDIPGATGVAHCSQTLRPGRHYSNVFCQSLSHTVSAAAMAMQCAEVHACRHGIT